MPGIPVWVLAGESDVGNEKEVNDGGCMGW